MTNQLILILFFFVVLTLAHTQPDFSAAREIYFEESEAYMNAYTASAHAGIGIRSFNRITGVVLIVVGQKRFPISDNDVKINVGLNLKSFKQVTFI